MVVLLAVAPVRAEEPTNPTCPVMEGELVDPAVFADYEGRRIWFATDTARQLFEMSPEDYLEALPPVAPWVEARVVATGPAEPAARIGVSTIVARLHPAFVHFPVALLIAAAAAELLALAHRRKRDALRAAGAWCVALAAAGCVPAIASGLLLAESHGGGDAATIELLSLHKWLGIATGISAMLSALLLSRSTHPKWGATARKLYVVTVVGGAMLVAIAGHFGAMLVYGRDWLPF